MHRPNHEKLFYNSLIKFRDEQLENYQGPLEYSASDYHHISRPVAKPMKKQMSSSRIHQNGRRRSQFSIVTDEVCSRNGSYKEPKSSRTIESYDPYRSSRTPISDPPVEYASVTVHRKPSGVSTKRQVSGVRHQAVARVQTEEVSSSPPQSQTSSYANSHLKRNSATSFQSRSSIASSRRGCASIPARRSAGYQRNVSFNHIRKRPRQASQTQSHHSIGPDYSDHLTPQPNKINILSPDRYSSPSLPTPPPPARHRKTSGRATTQLNPKKPRVPSNYWKEEARKVSSELGQICEEAFNRSSVSPDRPSVSHQQPEAASSKPAASPEAPQGRVPGDSHISRPSPQRPPESTTSYTTRELMETRRRLVEYSNKEHSEGLPAYLTEVIAHLDRLIQHDPFDSDRERRAISDPIPNLDLASEQLPPISEEQRISPATNDSIELPGSKQNLENDPERVASGSTKRSGSSFGCGDERSTIRIVPQTPASTPQADSIKPLTICKRSSALTTATYSGGNSSQDLLGDFMNSTPAPSGEEKTPLDLSSTSTHRGVSGPCEAPFSTGLDTILEDPRSPKRSDTVTSGDNKKWSWFKHRSQGPEMTPDSPVKEAPPSRPASALGLLSDLKLGIHSNEAKSEKVVSKRTSFERGKSGLLKLFGKKTQNRKPSHEVAIEGKFHPYYAQADNTTPRLKISLRGT